MKRLLIAVLLLVSTAYTQETATPRQVALGEEFTIRIGEQVAVIDTKLKITFIAVPEDSRCPEDVVCGWAGNAKLKFKLKAKEKTKLAFNTISVARESEFHGYKIRFIGLTPNRKYGHPIPPEAYEARLIVTN